MKNPIGILLLFMFEFAVTWLWVCYVDPDPSISIYLIVLVPLIWIVNLILSGILFLRGRKKYSIILLINSVVASMMMSYLFKAGIDRHQHERLESWQFQKADPTFHLTRWKQSNEFTLSYSTSPSSSWGFLDALSNIIMETGF